jgi:hypothetical protein
MKLLPCLFAFAAALSTVHREWESNLKAAEHAYIEHEEDGYIETVEEEVEEVEGAGGGGEAREERLHKSALTVVHSNADGRTRLPETNYQRLGLRSQNSPSSSSDVLVLIAGGARTFLHTFDSQITSVIDALGHADVYLYLKLTDPGPKGQEGWNFKYKDQNKEAIELKIKQCSSVVGYELVNGDPPNETQKMLRDLDCRRIFKGYMDEGLHRVRAMLMHQTLHTAGKVSGGCHVPCAMYVCHVPCMCATHHTIIPSCIHHTSIPSCIPHTTG